jgi:ADP-glucose pyrophosphorylase
VAKDIKIGEGSQISKCVIGRGVVIGKKVKIANCVILNNIEIANE